jgi:predicted DCC family thiol-disulfide oxidoreductase YuxK
MGRPMIVFFDGFCHLCNGFVDFVLKYEDHNSSQKKIQFAPLQGETAKTVLLPFLKTVSPGLDQNLVANPSTVIVLVDGQVYTKSLAVLLVFRAMGSPWKIFWLFRYLPQFLRDAVYDFIAARRLIWFGEREVCRLPTEKEKGRLLG